MTDYKPGDKVEFQVFPTAGAGYSAGTKITGVIVYGPYKERKHMPPVVLIETEDGLCITRAVTIITLASPEPEWEYGYEPVGGGDTTSWVRKGEPYPRSQLFYRRQVGKPETVELLTAEQVEELRND